MSEILTHADCRTFIAERVRGLPRRGRGQLRRMALALNVSSSYVSQMLKGKKSITVEKAALIAQFLNLSEFEAQVFVCMAQLECAGNAVLKQHYLKQLQELRESSSQGGLEKSQLRSLTAEEEARLYSYWYYSAVHLCTSVPGLRTVDRISQRLDIPVSVVNNVLSFLQNLGLCRRTGNTYRAETGYSLISSESQMLDRLLRNWRETGLDRVAKSRPGKDLFFSLPVATDPKSSEEVRQILLEAINLARDRLEQTQPNSIHCLNIDWFEI